MSGQISMFAEPKEKAPRKQSKKKVSNRIALLNAVRKYGVSAQRYIVQPHPELQKDETHRFITQHRNFDNIDEAVALVKNEWLPDPEMKWIGIVVSVECKGGQWQAAASRHIGDDWSPHAIWHGELTDGELEAMPPEWKVLREREDI